MSLQEAEDHYLMALIDEDQVWSMEPVRLAPSRTDRAKYDLINLLSSNGFSKKQIVEKLEFIENKSWEDSVDAE